MTSDAKIGLLLGLVFIFIIAFVINGLPRLASRTGMPESELATTMASSPRKPVGIASTERKATEYISRVEATGISTVDRPVSAAPAPAAGAIASGVTPGQGQERYSMPLPSQTSTVPAAADVAEAPAVAVFQPPAVTRKTSAAAGSEVPVSRPAIQKSHLVAPGDSLSSIARKYYGPEAGNVLANIDRIYQANSRILKSRDNLFVGQRLIIPPLPAGEDPVVLADEKTFERVGSMTPPAVTRQPAAGPARRYSVQSGDSLWRIAEKQLGDGNRYRELMKLNADQLPDEDHLELGMKLRLPPG